jgi:hypothetical protein
MLTRAQNGVGGSQLRRFAIVALCLPTAIIVIDHLTWMDSGLLSTYELKRGFFFPWTIAKTALLAWVAGRVFGDNFYGWLLLGWGVTLIDVNIYGASNDRFGTSDVVGLAYTIISAQAGFLVLWSILSNAALGWRIASAMIAAAAIIYHASSLFTSWRAESLPPVQIASAAILGIVCIWLRVKGFRVQKVLAGPENAQSKKMESLQFGVKHMLIWTTALPPLLLVMKGVDWLVFRRYHVVDLSRRVDLRADGNRVPCHDLVRAGRR